MSALACPVQVSYVDATSSEQRVLSFKVSLPLKTLVRPHTITTQQFGGLWAAHAAEKKTMLHAGSFAAYFKGIDGVSSGGGGKAASAKASAKSASGAAMLSIPGRTFPITDFFIEDAIEATGYVAKGKILLRGEQAEEELAALENAAAAGGAGGSGAAAAVDVTDEESVTTEGGRYSERTKAALQPIS